MTDTKAPATNGKATWLILLQFTLPVILAIIAGYGSVKYTSGETQSKLIELERRIEANTEAISRVSERAIPRSEIQLYMEFTKENFEEIKRDLRAIRDRQK